MVFSYIRKTFRHAWDNRNLLFWNKHRIYLLLYQKPQIYFCFIFKCTHLICSCRLHIVTCVYDNKIENEKYHSVRTVPKSNKKIVDKGKFYTSNILVIFLRQFNKKWRGETCFINSNAPFSEMMQSWTRCLLAYNWDSSAV